MKTHTFTRFAVVVALLAACCGCTRKGDDYPIDRTIYERLPFAMEVVQQPSFPDYRVTITDFGAVADGVTLCHEAINKAIDHVSAKGGGTVIIPAGLWLAGPIELKSNVNLHTEDGALVYFSDDHSLYPIIDTSFEGLETRRCTSPISAWHCENIAITGQGVFDGNGDTWRAVKKSKLTESQWKKKVQSGGVLDGDTWYPSEGSIKGMRACKEFNNPSGINTPEQWDSIRDWLRPVLLNFVYCQRVLIEDCTFKNSPAWCLHPRSCNHITLNRVKVNNPWYSQNGDALDMESCTNAIITRCHFDAGDDAICIKSGKNEEGRRRGEPTKGVIVTDNVIYHGHGGFTVGSEMSGGVQNIWVDNCTFMGTDVGLRFKSCRGRGGLVENIYISRIHMINIPAEGILFNLFYSGKSREEVTYDEEGNALPAVLPEVDETTPVFRNIYISDILGKGVGRAVFFNGLPEKRIDNIHLDRVTFTDANEGAVFCEAENIVINDLDITTRQPGPACRMQGVSHVSVDGREYDHIGKEQEISIAKPN